MNHYEYYAAFVRLQKKYVNAIFQAYLGARQMYKEWKHLKQSL